MKYTERILSLIPKGKVNAISRSDLVALTGISDRTIREIIKKLIKDGNIILSSSKSKGYWISNNDDEIKDFLKESDNRRRTEYFNTDPIRRLYYKRKGIRTVEVRGHLRKLSQKDGDASAQ